MKSAKYGFSSNAKFLIRTLAYTAKREGREDRRGEVKLSMAEKIEAERRRAIEVPISPSIPSGEGTVWADVSSLLGLACNGILISSALSNCSFIHFLELEKYN